jgi:hypothetical protein
MLNWLWGRKVPRIVQIIPNHEPLVRALISYETSRTTAPIIAWVLVDHGGRQSVSGIAVESSQTSLIPATAGRFERYTVMYREADL